MNCQGEHNKARSTYTIGEDRKPEHRANDSNEKARADEAELFFGAAEEIEFVDPVVEVFGVGSDGSVGGSWQFLGADFFGIAMLPGECIGLSGSGVHSEVTLFLKALVVRGHFFEESHPLHNWLDSHNTSKQSNYC